MSRRAALVAVALALGACGGGDGGGGDYEAWKSQVERQCERFVDRLDELPSSDLRGKPLAEQLNRLSPALRAGESLVARTVAAMRQVPLPTDRRSDAEAFLDRFASRGENLGEMAAAADRGDVDALEDLSKKDGVVGNEVAAAAERADIDCGGG
jgi:hypothetical protein